MLDTYSSFIHKTRYSRYLEDKKRRETWEETVTRYMDYMKLKLKEVSSFDLSNELYDELWKSIHDREVMPSMRLLMSAGKAADRDSSCTYNCTYLPIDNEKSFDELMHLLMNGAGVGFSVERQYINQLPEIPDKIFDSETIIAVKDSKEGWAKALRQLIALLYTGEIPKWDLSRIRPEGARLKTFGGKASGPKPLDDCFKFVVKTFKNAKGRKLTSLECHDIVCKIAEVVIVAGIRRCLPSKSKIHTKNGMVNIENIQIGDLVLTTNGYRKVLNKFDQGIQNVIKVTTQDSYFYCTSNHKIAILSGQDEYIWKCANELNKGDRLIAPSFGIDGEDVKLPDFSYVKPKHSTTCKDIIIPELDRDVAWFLGLIQGDGYVRLTSKSGDVSVSCHKNIPQIIEKAKSIFERFGVKWRITEYNNYVVISVKSKQLATYFHSWLKQPKIELKVPDFIWKASNDIRLSYIGGIMDADGSTKNRPITVMVSIYKNFVNEIRLLLSSCGIQSRVNKMSEKNLKSNWHKKFAVVLINSEAKRKMEKYTFKEMYISEIEQYTNSYSKEMLDFAYANNFPWSKTNNRLIPSALVSIENVAEKMQTWDIEVEEMHEFFCEGYLMHNSALISLSNLSDDRMRNAKSGAWWEANVQRALANNSAVYTEKPDIGMFMKEWLSLYESKSGERGIFNRQASKKQAAKNGRRDSNFELGSNPCHTRSMKLLTAEGYKTFGELENTIFDIINSNGNITKGNVWKSGRKPVFRIEFLNKQVDSIEATADHVYKLSNGEECEVKDLVGKRPKRYVKMRCAPDSSYEEEFHAGFALGDGVLSDLLKGENNCMSICIGSKDHDVLKYLGNATIKDLDTRGHLYTKYNANVARKFNLPSVKIGSRGLPESIRTKNGLMGLFSANGCVIKESRIALKTTDYEQANDLVNVLYDMFNINAYITTNKTKENKFSNGIYRMKESYDVNIGRYVDIIKFAEEIGFVQKYKQDSLQNLIDKRAPTVKSISPIGEMDVYDFNEPEINWGVVNGCVVHNCSEIILRPNQKCNLTEVIVKEYDTVETLKNKMRLASILGTYQSTFTNFPYLRKIWTKNCEEERLLGVSMTGIYDNKLLSDHHDSNLPSLLESLKEMVVNTNKEWANKLNIPQSTATTAIKPSGSVSELVGSSSGIHPRYGKYYKRRVRNSILDPMTKYMMDKGIPYEIDVTNPNTVIFEFVKKSPESSIMRKDISAIDHLELWLLYQRYYCEHKPSITVNVKEDEWLQVGSWVYDHFDEITGVSFLPYDNGTYRQAPFEEITKEEYDAFNEKYKLDFALDDFIEDEDNVNGMQMLSCVAGGCDI